MGAVLSSISVIFMVFSTSYWAIALYLVCLSIGEALWSPRLYDYAFNYVEKGKEGMFMALTSAPNVLTSFLTGYYSGRLLERYCPVSGERSSRMMWLYILFSAIFFPLLIFVCRGCLEHDPKEEEETKATSPAKGKAEQKKNS